MCSCSLLNQATLHDDVRWEKRTISAVQDMCFQYYIYEGDRWIKMLAVMVVSSEPDENKWSLFSATIKRLRRNSYELCSALRFHYCMTSWLVYFPTNYIFAALTTTLNNTYHSKSASSLLITSYSFLYNLFGRIHHIELDRFCHSYFSLCWICIECLNAWEALSNYLHWLLSWTRTLNTE